MLRKSFIFVVVLAVAAVLGASPAQAGDGATYVIQNGSNRPLVIDIGPVWECIEPDLTVGFIGARITLAPGESYSKVLWRRDGHGCDGDDAKWSATPTYDGKTYAPQLFRLTGSGGIVRDGAAAAGYRAVFDDAPDAANTNSWQLFMDDPVAGPARSAYVKADLLRRYAPQVWLSEAESFMPSSVDYALSWMEPVTRDGQVWMYTKDDLDDGFPRYLHGQAASQATSYAFWQQKNVGGYVDLIYFHYYPFNLGKKQFGTVYGNHVSDWETMTVRLDTMLQPKSVILSQHDHGETIPWRNIQKAYGTHPVVYAALGSHGLYSTVGSHQYVDTFWVSLYDDTDRGRDWSTWENLETFDVDLKQGLYGSRWPAWLEPTNVYRWGNGKNGCGDDFVSDSACELADGPTGPLSKSSVFEQSAICYTGQGENTWRDTVCGSSAGVLSTAAIVGTYKRANGVQNAWHKGEIRQVRRSLRWVNDAGVSWSLTPDWGNRRLVTGPDNPYHGTENAWTEFQLIVVNGVYQGYKFNGDVYRKVR